MGAVFAIFSGFYFWFETMTGLRINESCGRIHFWTFFIGVNVTFFPMHFLGLAGMPRRISDYPDAFAEWNLIASIGSIISIVASIWFFFIVYNAFNPWNESRLFFFFNFLIFFFFVTQHGIFGLFITTIIGYGNSFFNWWQYIFDAPRPWQMTFQDPATNFMNNIIDLHHDIMYFLILIISLVSIALFFIVVCFGVGKYPTSEYHTLKYYDARWSRFNVIQENHDATLEQVWTMFPAFILCLIAFPSFSLLYSMDVIKDIAVTLKVTGYQWYWGYEFPNFNYSTFKSLKFMSFESRMLPLEDILATDTKQLRLLEVDHMLILPIKMPIRLLVTAADVLHSWAVPSLGIKVDACPGRLNQVYFEIERPGSYYGQCSEICGLNHGFMPIVILAVPLSNFIDLIDHYVSLTTPLINTNTTSIIQE